MTFFLALVVDGLLAGILYALTAVAFVIVYKAARMINFALGEWVVLGALLVATALHVLQLGLLAAVGAACVAMIGFALVFDRLVLRPLLAGPLIALIMVTLGLGALMRGAAPLVFAGVPRGIALPAGGQLVAIGELRLPAEKLMAAAVAIAVVAGVALFYQRSRTGLALRAVADDRQAAMAAGIDVHRYVGLAWAMAGVVCVLAGTLWTSVAGGGFGVALVGLKVFPIVIIGGLDSIAGTIVGAVLIGLLESLSAGYLDPLLGGGFGSVAAYAVLIVMLFVRPHGLFGRKQVERV
ncbi:MAG: branched-chain amino acid ABC transporter permease [Alphaproteobacteria bacterium]|nr:branched-chain amino acid ABC transporter permease [Alphaproteobacteria bacterium]